MRATRRGPMSSAANERGIKLGVGCGKEVGLYVAWPAYSSTGGRKRRDSWSSFFGERDAQLQGSRMRKAYLFAYADLCNNCHAICL